MRVIGVSRLADNPLALLLSVDDIPTDDQMRALHNDLADRDPRKVGAENLESVRAWFCEHLCGTQRECAEALGLSVMAVNRHVKTIRAEWRDNEA